MSDLEYLTGICQSILNPHLPMTEAEKEEILRMERDEEFVHDMEEIYRTEDWPPYDIALEL